MEPHLAAAVAVVLDGLSVVVVLASVAVLFVTAQERQSQRLRAARPACALASGLLFASTLVGAIDRWALVVSCLAFLASLQAMAMAFGYLAPLQSYLGLGMREGEGAWWEEFERGFSRYAARRRRWERLRRGGRPLREGTPAESEDQAERSGS